MTGELDVRVVVEQELPWWRPPAQALPAVPHLVVTGVLSIASVAVAVAIGAVVIVTGRVPRGLARFQVMTLRERVRCYSYFFVLRTTHPPFNLAVVADDPGDDESARFSAQPVDRVPRRDLARRIVLVPHLLVLIPMGAVMDACYPLWVSLAAVNRGWPAAFRSLLVAVEKWVVAVAAYALFVTNTPPAFGLGAYGYTGV